MNAVCQNFGTVAISLMCYWLLYFAVGQPIEVEKVLDPDQSTIDHVHQQYMSTLSELFDQHKVQYGVDKNLTLNFIWRFPCHSVQ